MTRIEPYHDEQKGSVIDKHAKIRSQWYYLA